MPRPLRYAHFDENTPSRPAYTNLPAPLCDWRTGPEFRCYAAADNVLLTVGGEVVCFVCDAHRAAMLGTLRLPVLVKQYRDWRACIASPKPPEPDADASPAPDGESPA
jgi:hypothetical protein